MFSDLKFMSKKLKGWRKKSAKIENQICDKLILILFLCLTKSLKSPLSFPVTSRGPGPSATLTAPAARLHTPALWRPLRNSAVSATTVTNELTFNTHTNIPYVFFKLLFHLVSLSGALHPPARIAHQALSCQQCGQREEGRTSVTNGSSGPQEVSHSLRGETVWWAVWGVKVTKPENLK